MSFVTGKRLSIALPSCAVTLGILAVLGLLGAIAFILKGSAPHPVAQSAAPPTLAPYANYVAGSGMIAASTRNIAVSTLVGGVVAEVSVKVGDRVQKGQEFFRIDGRDFDAQLTAREAAAAAARVSQSRSRYPLRCASRHGLRSPAAAPVRSVTSIFISRCAAKPIISRKRSASEPFSRSVRRFIISSVIVGSTVRVIGPATQLYRRSR
jgi:multidrug efflux pump subunit AcrA (membrane-fusion protein)